MDILNCLKCGGILPTRGYFCPTCKEQTRCKACNELLEPDIEICVMCGEEVQTKTKEFPMNNIKFREVISGNKSEREFQANFTNEVGSNISEAYFNFLGSNGNRVPAKKKQTQIGQTTLFQDIAEATEIQSDSKDSIEASKTNYDKEFSGNTDLEHLKEIFNIDAEAISLNDIRIRAKNARDCGKRLVCLYLYLKKLLGIDKTPRIEITQIAKQASIEDSNFRKWFREEKSLHRQDGDEVILLAPGLDFAKEVLKEIKNPETTEVWKPTPPKKRKSKKEEGDD